MVLMEPFSYMSNNLPTSVFEENKHSREWRIFRSFRKYVIFDFVRVLWFTGFTHHLVEAILDSMPEPSQAMSVY